MRSSIKANNNERGFTLVETAIGLFILGAVLALGLVALAGVLRFQSEKATFKRMEQIADAISLYAQRHMRVPCPADPTPLGGAGRGSEPFGAERGTDAQGRGIGACDLGSAEGIIPFATLGLPQKMAFDRFNRYFTYRVSVTSAIDPALVRDPAAGVLVNNWYRSEPFWHVDVDLDGDGSGDGGGGEYDFMDGMEKAAFCGGTFKTTAGGGVPQTDPSTDVQLQGAYGPLQNLSREIENYGGDVGEYGPPRADGVDANPASPSHLTNKFTPIFPAYVLVSHGENGNGAFVESGVRGALGGLAPTSPERENANGNRVFFVSDRANPAIGGTALFRPQIDDLVFWETPAQVLSRVGEVSCSRP